METKVILVRKEGKLSVKESIKDTGNVSELEIVEEQEIGTDAKDEPVAVPKRRGRGGNPRRRDGLPRAVCSKRRRYTLKVLTYLLKGKYPVSAKLSLHGMPAIMFLNAQPGLQPTLWNEWDEETKWKAVGRCFANTRYKRRAASKKAASKEAVEEGSRKRKLEELQQEVEDAGAGLQEEQDEDLPTTEEYEVQSGS
jgi:hypothetical protein